MKITIAKCKVRGVIKWRVRWHEGGRVKRKFFPGRDAADTHASTLRGDAVSYRQRLAALPAEDQERLLAIYGEAQKRGLDLFTLLANAQDAPAGSPAIADVCKELDEAKRKAGRDGDYLKSIRQIGKRFTNGRGRLAINKVTLAMVEAFLDSHPLKSRSTVRARLSTLFKFAVRRGYRTDNPCNALEATKVVHEPPAILSVEQVSKCLKWLRLNPRSLAWFALSAFAGLRPEEAEQTTWRDIHFKEGWIKVEAQTSKTRQRRVVYPMPMALEWLKEAKRLKAKLPLAQKARTVDRKELRTVIGWSEWKQDCTRHTAASYWLAESSSVAAVATSLGNSEAVMKKHYMALVTRDEAKKFWALKP